jgi:hypothetical protein
MSIVIRIKGGIGNQLFMYAAARRLALISNQELLLDDISGFVNDLKYNRRYQLDHFNIPCQKAKSMERLEPFSKARRVLKRTINFFLPFETKNYIKQYNAYFDSKILDLRVKQKLYLEGYFQSEAYFKDFEFQISKDLKICPPKDDLNNELALKIKKNFPAVALHFRFFNKTSNNEIDKKLSINASINYYHAAIKKIEKLFPNAHYFIFSDKPEEAKKQIAFSDKRMTLVSHNDDDEYAFADLWLMTQCQHFIIANSTFSWWGAWLAKYKDKVVVAPSISKKYRHWADPKLLPKEWLQL